MTKVNGKYTSKISIGGDRVWLGAFDLEYDAYLAYKIYKEEHVRFLANKWRGLICESVYQAMMNYRVDIDD